jgi:hypothetical protein
VPTYDQLFINGTFTAAGTLTVTAMAPFNPAIAQQFVLIQFLAREGDFSTVNLPDLPAPRQWKQQKWFENDFTLEVE